MGKFTCECGHVISDTMMPCNEMNFLVTSSMAFDYPEKVEDELSELTELWECPNCLGLMRFDNSAVATCYYKRIEP